MADRHLGPTGLSGLPWPVLDDGALAWSTRALSFDVTTLLSRRRMLKAFGLGAATLGLAACGVDSTSSAASSSSSAATGGCAAAGTLTEIPDETNGPYPVRHQRAGQGHNMY